MCFGIGLDVVEVFWTCFASVLHVFWDVFWKCFGSVLVCFWILVGNGFDRCCWKCCVLFEIFGSNFEACWMCTEFVFGVS